jgi:hypothetical protein
MQMVQQHNELTNQLDLLTRQLRIAHQDNVDLRRQLSNSNHQSSTESMEEAFETKEQSIREERSMYALFSLIILHRFP